MSEKADYSWKEVSLGQYERDVDEAEWIYTSLAKAYEGTGHTYFAITACTGVTIPFKLPEALPNLEQSVESAFRHAWTKLRHEHPSIAAAVEYQPSLKKYNKAYKSPQNQNDVEFWLQETFKSINNGITGIEFSNTDPTVGRYATLYLITPPGTQKDSLRRDILFRSPHDIIDGMGTFHLLNILLQYASEALLSPSPPSITFSTSHQNLSPPLRIAANIPQHPTPAQVINHQAIRAKNKTANSHPYIMSIPFNTTQTTPLRSQRISMHLTTLETTHILKKCKSLNTTATHAIHASIALALRDVQPRADKAREGRYISYALINLRNVCKPPYDSPKYAAGVYHAVSAEKMVVDLEIPAVGEEISPGEGRDEFLRVLGNVKAFYGRFKPDEEYLSTLKEKSPYPSPWNAPSNESQISTIPPPDPAPSVSLSSLGVIDKVIQPIREAFVVEEPWVMGAEYSTGLGVFLGTWRGRMAVSVGFNEAFHGEREVRSFLGRVRGIVLGGLGLEGEGDVSWE